MTSRRRQLWVLAVLTLVWGLNWPVMKLGVSGWPTQPDPFPPLTFRALSMLFGVPVLGAALVAMRVPLRLPRAFWRETVLLALPNMVIWHVVVIVAVQALSSGRAAILGYSMPVFAALLGVLVFGDRFTRRQALGVGAATVGIGLLLAHEFGKLSGAPGAALAVLVAACIWAYGTHRLRRAAMPVPLLTVVFWMTALTAAVLCVLAFVFERQRWHVLHGMALAQWLPPHVAWPVAYNAVGVFGFAHAAWFYLARTMPPVASSVSVMLIPVLGTFAGALVLNEALHWQDFAAVVLVVAAIAAVLVKPAAGAAVSDGTDR